MPFGQSARKGIGAALADPGALQVRGTGVNGRAVAGVGTSNQLTLAVMRST